MKFILLQLIAILFFGCYNPDNKTESQIQKSDSFKQEAELPVVCGVLNSLSGQGYAPEKIKNNYKVKQSFSMLNMLNLDSGIWVVVLDVFAYKNGGEGYVQSEIGLPKAGYYVLRDINIIKEMKKDWIVTLRGDDCCTPDFSVNFYQNGFLKLNLGVISDGSLEGFQNEFYGWTPTKNKDVIRKYYKYFEYCDATEKKNLHR